MRCKIASKLLLFYGLRPKYMQANFFDY